MIEITSPLLKQHNKDLKYRLIFQNNKAVGGYFHEEGHIALYEDKIVIQDLTMFPGFLTPWSAIKWGVGTWTKRFTGRVKRSVRGFKDSLRGHNA